MSAEYTIRLIVHGRVQGVFFRASARAQALRLGLDGWVCNLPDGTVETLAAGPRLAIAGFEQWCGKGPPGARVDRIDRLPVAAGEAPARGSSFHVQR